MQSIAIFVLAGTLWVAPLVKGKDSQFHTTEVSYPTPAACSITAPISGSYTPASWTHIPSGDWIGC